MPYDFFFSYTRANNGPYLKRFFKDLNEEVRTKAGYPIDTVAGFLDQRMELGTDWSADLVKALQECSTLVCLYSPAYFNSEFCGREWGFFEGRRALYVEKQRNAGLPAESPAVIKPVLWVPLEDALPPGVDGKQFTEGDPHAAQNAAGLRFVIQQYPKFRILYRDFVNRLADEILAAKRQYRARLPVLIGATDFHSVRNAFQRVPAPVVEETPKRRGQGPNAVKFVFVAGKPEEFPVGTRTTECYRYAGGRDWKPYYPHRLKPIGALAQSVAAGEDFDFFSEEIPWSSALPGEVRKAEEQANIVVLMVDGWTVALPSYRQILEEFDKAGYFNCSVLIPWNEKDAETSQQRAALNAQVRDVFRRQSRQPLYFRDSISSEEELRSELRDVLIRLRAEVFNLAPVTRPVPGGEAKPGLQGPSAGNLTNGGGA